MPIMKVPAEVEFEVYCGNCKEGICFDTKVKGQTLTVTCSYCKQEMKDLEHELKILRAEFREEKRKKRTGAK